MSSSRPYKLLHLSPHLGGGVGKAHAALAKVDSGLDEHTHILLEDPRDRRFVDALQRAGRRVVTAPSLDEIIRLAEEADIVQVEWWNHPLIYAALASNRLPAMRLATWVHISGIGAPLIAPGLIGLSDAAMFTSACSLEALTLTDAIAANRDRVAVVNSGFGLDDPLPRAHAERLRFGYLGTVDFAKLHPDILGWIDRLTFDLKLSIWGNHDDNGPVAHAHRAMRHPERIRFAGHADDPARVMSEIDVFLYPLNPDHYGTAENALVEAMSAGATPVVLDNPAERSIVRHGETGLIVSSEPNFAETLRWAIDHPAETRRIGRAASIFARQERTPEASNAALLEIYSDLMERPKTERDFRAVLGASAEDWFASTIAGCERTGAAQALIASPSASKGSLAHFRHYFSLSPTPDTERKILRA